ncbi:hypothetical protein T4C_1588 [Trichinella pseudospiralis]|uniref:Uncharacterized protein n=1 Tax=Trichinella pseudospiralis TaxID=6337 RepID=A0A0V1KD69_TRIPS|nr:hypothetical protein T4C_1588 [Trichinella pseudospiralis]
MKIKQQSHERTQVRQVEQQAFGQELRKLSRKGRIAAADRLDRQTRPISRLRFVGKKLPSLPCEHEMTLFSFTKRKSRCFLRRHGERGFVAKKHSRLSEALDTMYTTEIRFWCSGSSEDMTSLAITYSSLNLKISNWQVALAT